MTSPKHTAKLLIVDDDALVRIMVRGTLEKLGYKVVGEAADGEEACRMTEELRPDLVLMDIHMENVDGVEATRRINAQWPTPVVLLTAYESTALVEWASEAGVVGYVIKPPTSRELERAIMIGLARFPHGQDFRRIKEELAAVKLEVEGLRALLPICSACRSPRTEESYLATVRRYVDEHAAELGACRCSKCGVEPVVVRSPPNRRVGARRAE
jgi:AmiR/NasT family two-component response regulator